MQQTGIYDYDNDYELLNAQALKDRIHARRQRIFDGEDEDTLGLNFLEASAKAKDDIKAILLSEEGNLKDELEQLKLDAKEQLPEHISQHYIKCINDAMAEMWF